MWFDFFGRKRLVKWFILLGVESKLYILISITSFIRLKWLFSVLNEIVSSWFWNKYAHYKVRISIVLLIWSILCCKSLKWITTQKGIMKSLHPYIISICWHGFFMNMFLTEVSHHRSEDGDITCQFCQFNFITISLI